MNKSNQETRVWSAGLVALSACVAVLAFVEDRQGSLLTIGALLAIVIAWFLLVAPTKTHTKSNAAGITFAVVLAVAMGIGVYGTEWMQLMLFIAYPLCFITTPSILVGNLASWGLTALVGLALFANRMPLLDVLGYSIIVGLFSSAMGLWFNRIWQWGLEREQMRTELAASQDLLVKAAQQQATLAERARLAREVHDTLAQGYVAIIALAQTPGTRAQIEAVARENLSEARALINARKSPALADADLSGALQRLANARGADFDGKVAEVPVEVETTLFRAAQEALTNVARHARAQRTSILLAEDDAHYFLRVTDDGVGINNSPEGNGLRGMRERAAMLGGGIDIAMPPDGGTSVTVTIPKEDRP